MKINQHPRPDSASKVSACIFLVIQTITTKFNTHIVCWAFDLYCKAILTKWSHRYCGLFQTATHTRSHVELKMSMCHRSASLWPVQVADTAVHTHSHTPTLICVTWLWRPLVKQWCNFFGFPCSPIFIFRS